MHAKTSARWFLSLALLLSMAARADEASLSHLVVHTDTNQALVGIGVGAVSKFCGDADGCEIVVRLERATEARTLTGRLFLNAGVANRWFSSATAGAYFVDTDGDPNQALRLDAGPSTCIIDDGDSFDPGLDNTPGFELGVFGDAGTSCTIVISD